MLNNPKFISPIAIDLGAKNTGVYFAHYPKNSNLDQIEKKGKVYKLDDKSYTFLMQGRTAHRHQRRGLDRRQMVKRLFKLIWCEHLKLEWNNETQQAVSFLFNRRGFSFLTEEYDPEILKEFPKEALTYSEIPKELKEKLIDGFGSGNTTYNFSNKLNDLSKDEESFKEIFKIVDEKNKTIKNKLYVIKWIEKLKEYCEQKQKNQSISENKKNVKLLPKWVLEEWKKRGIKEIKIGDENERNDIVQYLNDSPKEEAKQILDSIPSGISNEKKRLEGSIWHLDKFNLEKADFLEPEERQKKEDWKKTHCHHLIFALKKINDEIVSGGRYRSKYFEEIKEVLKYDYDNNKDPRYLKNFCNKLKSSQFKPLDVDKLVNLIGNLSNFELKLLRSYFDDIKYKKEDEWDAEKLKKKFEHWVLKIWRINPEKDKDKAIVKDYDYKKLRVKVKGVQDIIDFLLDTDPNWTIPPYQDNNNRRPPKCQSLILNIKYLDRNYSEWIKWLELLKDHSAKYLSDYEIQLKELKSGKGKKYFDLKVKNGSKNLKTDSKKRTEKHLKARLLQFIFDRAKKTDEFKLNEIFSVVKKIKQNKRDEKSIEEEKKELERIKQKSKLPQELNTAVSFNQDDIFPQGSFLHLICKYYKLRQRAKAGRLFIHPQYRYIKGRGYENMGRFEDKSHLLSYCNHHPRQKRYQVFDDLSDLFQISKKKLEEVVKSDRKNTESGKEEVVKSDGENTESDKQLTLWLKKIKGLESNSQKAAKELKDRRNSLQSDINRIYKLKKTEKKLIKDDKKLFKLVQRAKELYIEISKKINENEQQIKNLEESLDKNPSKAVYFLAQINNLVFKDRNGNAKTCSVCSADNAQRMQTTEVKNKYIARAGRLSAISTRVIDGAVMRMARILGKAIAKEKWEDISSQLESDNPVCVPIITESNQFEFEPSREDLVKEKRRQKRQGKVLKRGEEFKIFSDKENRIKEAGCGICPYEGVQISKGELDHIIPRSSQWGVLNDEANLIWASEKGNKNKGDKFFLLKDLNKDYKKEQFENKSDEEIKEWIKDQIWNEDSEDFKFGKYTNFISLSSDEQKAFRHALFLEDKNPIKKTVVQAIDNRNRAFVNGTQRYFAEVLANEIYKKAKKEKKQNLLSFDYFSIPAEEIHFIRKTIENIKDEKGSLIYKELEKYKKTKDNKEQKNYSHLIDAQIAFIASLSRHYNEGSFKIKADFVDPIKDYKRIKALGNNIVEELSRLKENFPSRTFFDSNPGAWHFLKLIEIKVDDESHYLKGFLDFKILESFLELGDWSSIQKKIKESYCYNGSPYAEILEDKKMEKLVKLYCVGNNKYEFGYQKKGQEYPKMILDKNIENKKIQVFLYQIDKSKVASFLLKNFHTKTNPEDWKKEECEIFKQLQKLWYFTKKKNLNKKEEWKKVICSFYLSDFIKDKLLNKSNLLNPSLVAEFFLKDLHTKINLEDWKKKECEIFKQLQKLWFSKKRKNLNEEEWKKDIYSFDFSYFIKDKLLIKSNLLNPSLKKAWELARSEWGNNKPEEGKDFQDFLERFFIKNRQFFPHLKTRKNFSLPIVSKGLGFMLIKRKSWNNGIIYQFQSEKSSTEGMGRFKKYIDQNGDSYDLLTQHYRSKNIVVMKELKILKKELQSLDSDTLKKVDENKWYSLPNPKDEKLKNVKSIGNKYQSKNKSQYKITFKNEPSINDVIECISSSSYKLSNLKLIKSDKEKTKSFFEDCNSISQGIEKLKVEIKKLTANLRDKSKYKEEKSIFNKWKEYLEKVQVDKKELIYEVAKRLKIISKQV